MDRSEKNLKALVGASKNATDAFDALHSPEYKHVPHAEKAAWVMAAVIHCDLCRLVVSLDECEPGIAKLLSMADIVSKLYEAKKWYLGVGAKALRKIAEGKSCDTTIVDAKLKELKSLHPIVKVEKYAVYRNKVGYHYDVDTPTYLTRFGQEDSDDFYALLITFSRFSGEWAKLTKRVIQEASATS
jgi:hypothetical protein